MESETNKEIREVLELFGITKSDVKGKWNIIGHLANVCEKHSKREFNRKIEIAKTL